MNEYLYHYTNLNAFALILKTKRFRFNSLKNMDDAEEVVTANSDFLGKYCFVSSWTDLEEESIPFWAMYTDNMTGLRIRMKKYPFKKDFLSLGYYKNGKRFESYCPSKIVESYSIYLYPTIPFLRKVEYTNDEKLIFPEPLKHVSQNTDGTYNIRGNFNDIDKYKRDTWAFQSEWRYSLVFFPHDEKGRLNLDLSANGDDMPFWHVDLEIADEAYDTIQIVTGPKMPEGDKILLETLVGKYCPAAKIEHSTLKIN